jgi:hypothetical protein
MKRLFSALAAVSAVAFIPAAASAAVIVVHPGTSVTGAPGTGTTLTPPNSGTVAPGQNIYFNVSPQLNPSSPPTTVTALFGDIGIPTGDFTDVFSFLSPFPAAASGSVTTSVADLAFFSPIDTTIFSVVFNGITAPVQYFDANHNPCTTPRVGSCGASTQFALSDVPINFGATPNTITVTGSSLGNGSYAGQGTLIPTAVPEPATWAMMLLGFGAIGLTMRRKRGNVLAQIA